MGSNWKSLIKFNLNIHIVASIDVKCSRNSTLAKGEHRLIKTFFKKFLQKQQLRDENSLLNTETQHYISNEMEWMWFQRIIWNLLGSRKWNPFQNNEGIFRVRYKLSSINRMSFTTNFYLKKKKVTERHLQWKSNTVSIV